MLITQNNTTETSVHHYTTFASDLNFPRSLWQWPRQLDTTLGNGRPFEITAPLVAGEGAVYKQSLGCTQLTIFNT